MTKYLKNEIKQSKQDNIIAEKNRMSNLSGDVTSRLHLKPIRGNGCKPDPRRETSPTKHYLSPADARYYLRMSILRVAVNSPAVSV